MSDVSKFVTEDKINSNDLVRKLPNGAFLNISRDWSSAVNVSNSQQPETPHPATLAFKNVSESARLASVFVIIDNPGGQGTNTSAVELLLNFCVREYNTKVINGRASTNETFVTAANATLGSDDDSAPPIDISLIFLGLSREGSATSDIAYLFAEAIYTTPGDMSLLFSIMKNVATSLKNTYIFSAPVEVFSFSP
jgi:hypothetical protein